MLMKGYCLLCQKDVNLLIVDKKRKYQDEVMNIEYDGKVALCPYCKEEIYNDEVIKYNQDKIKETYSLEYEIITKDEIKEIIEKYKIGKRPLSLLLGFGEITITRYLEGYVPTPKNSKLLKLILSSPSDYYSILQMNKNNITDIAFKKSEQATKSLLGIKTNDDTIEEVSRYIVNKIDTTNMALQKLLYYIQMFYMGFYHKHAFSSLCSAWQYGPVFGSIYYKYKQFDKNTIVDVKPYSELDKDLKETVDCVIKYFGCYVGSVLKTFTHLEEPWINAYNTENKIIEKSAIKEYGEKIIQMYNMKSVLEINKYSRLMISKYYEKTDI